MGVHPDGRPTGKRKITSRKRTARHEREQLNTGERRRVYEKAGFTALPLVRYYKALPGHTG
jgi:hypothetical protein